jgi:hypothetical protein
MKRPIYILSLAILLAAGILYASTELQYFTAKSEQSAILLEWKTGTEDNLTRFEVERSASNSNNFMKIGDISAIGSNSYYYYRDDIAAFNSTSNTLYYYRLKLVNSNGSSSYSNTIIVTHIISSVRDTWGSIKAIFR